MVLLNLGVLTATVVLHHDHRPSVFEERLVVDKRSIFWVVLEIKVHRFKLPR